MPEIPQHYHCLICGKPIPVNETLCSNDCKEKYQAIMRRRRITIYLMYGILIAFVIAIIASSYI